VDYECREEATKNQLELEKLKKEKKINKKDSSHDDRAREWNIKRYVIAKRQPGRKRERERDASCNAAAR